MKSLTIVFIISSIVVINGAIIKRDAGYGAAPPPPAPSYGASSYAAPAPVYVETTYDGYEPDLKAKLAGLKEEIKSKILGAVGHVKGSLLVAKGTLLLKKASLLQEKGEKLLGLGQTLKALKNPADDYYPAPAPAY